MSRKIASIIRAVEDGLYQPSMKARMDELEAEKAELEKRLATPPPSSLRFHPGLAVQYRNQVANLEKALANPATHPNTVAAIRSQIEKITLTPRADGTLEVLLHGDLARILQFCEAGDDKAKRPGTEVPGREASVAGTEVQPEVVAEGSHGCNTRLTLGRRGVMPQQALHAPVTRPPPAPLLPYIGRGPSLFGRSRNLGPNEAAAGAAPVSTGQAA